MNRLPFPTGDRASDMAHIVRGVFDATDRLSLCTDTDTAAEAHRELDLLRARADSLGDPVFAAAFEAALEQLLPSDWDSSWGSDRGSDGT